ncbi:beta-ketoacyl-[acyl-carrier-protein] synthase family protein [Streptomyces daliensis]|uniref:Beta-ketoacyl-[acyl-carrier-protein] synthase family protein n=1 Tax=Streptomyces daliensis TaxID=299421 RepID=A0A8T4IHH4_9ACTN|nr:beta-ketoacyl-[acyl-carrier-protein] synthase family protein [Streptomyces daliensis]
MRRRSVVVTGMGVVCPLGATADELWHGLLTGRSGIVPLTRFDPGRFRSRYAGQIDDAAVTFGPGPLQFEIKRMSAFVRYALFAAGRALEDGGLVASPENTAGAAGASSSVPSAPSPPPQGCPPGGAVFLGVAMGGLPSIEAGVLRQEQRGVRRTSPFLIPSLLPNMAASAIALRHGIEDEQTTIAGACASGCQALGQAMRAIRSGDRTWALAGGAEAVTTPITYSGFEAMKVLSRRDDPADTPRPFDRERDGMVVGEAAAVFVLEDRDHAEARGAVVHGELTGFATNSGSDGIAGISAHHAARCMSGALADAAVAPDAIDCVFAQASGMVQGDAAEIEAVRTVASDARRKPPVTSIKGHVGHAFAANGPLNLAGALMAIRHRTVPPTLKLDHTDPSFTGVDIVREARVTEVRRCLVNACGFGGINASLVVSRG